MGAAGADGDRVGEGAVAAAVGQGCVALHCSRTGRARLLCEEGRHGRWRHSTLRAARVLRASLSRKCAKCNVLLHADGMHASFPDQAVSCFWMCRPRLPVVPAFSAQTPPRQVKPLWHLLPLQGQDTGREHLLSGHDVSA